MNVDKKFAFMILGGILILAGAIYAYALIETPNPGHDWNEIGNVPAGLDDGDDDTNAETKCGNNKFLDGDGQCRTTAQIVDDGIDCIIRDVWYSWNWGTYPSCPSGFSERTSGTAWIGSDSLRFRLCVKKSC